jgi:hypothetical protein
MPLPDGGKAPAATGQAHDSHLGCDLVQNRHMYGVSFTPKARQRPSGFAKLGGNGPPGIRVDLDTRARVMTIHCAASGDYPG